MSEILGEFIVLLQRLSIKCMEYVHKVENPM